MSVGGERYNKSSVNDRKCVKTQELFRPKIKVMARLILL